MDANAAAWDCREGSWMAWIERTEFRMERKLGLGMKESGVKGRVGVEPMVRRGCGGVVVRRESWYVEGLVGGEGWMYC